jgi:hypothetical protein
LASSDFSTFSTNTAYGWNGSFAGGKNHGETIAALLVVAFVSHAHAADRLPFGGEHLQSAYPPEIEPTYKPHVPQVGYITKLTIYRTPNRHPRGHHRTRLSFFSTRFRVYGRTLGTTF